ncbi:putative Zn-dependent protease with MMP-like domain [Rhodococcus sp. PvP016]|uniref:Zn-dependent protease with MMP-like domain n=2 Tax=Mycobacteriales TaxID=85007 RepID=A0ABS2KQU2_9NOCA|nr:putative Zn-dependent protease with MMP-like domain [Rhodococcus corynebacterioides]MBP1116746.1 putative Zn-dependent protease with MMP-like domain [Rhodococcus sp. PvP016]MDQ1180733.1 putative Zn-dependent protease with MMP-like domain [Rhodococcus sp. SORGH_AS_0301]MDQ1202068.1 putative Zn-dependent protease with MMP-like domain [Rhodococcus sp. SORGH_AS_0303]
MSFTGSSQPRGRAGGRPGREHRASSSRSAARRGRGMRGTLFPDTVPARRSRAEKFDAAVLDAFAEIDRKWHDRLTKLDIAVDDVPKIRAVDPESVNWPPEVVAEGPVPLSRLVPAGVDTRGATTRARIVLFRRPLERRAHDSLELTDLVHDVLVEQVATYLGVTPEVVDPDTEDD